MELYQSDNNGHRVPPGVVAADPIAGSGILLTDATIGADHTQTVVAGALYAVTFVSAVTGLAMYFGIAAVTSDVNVLWICVPYETIVIKIPIGITSLHYEGAVNGATVRLRRLL
jgi:hypothetical protein